tara:strand:- start:3767 stop:3937 length:171 start_codon:yes stop_codon:yes gene_type:complete
MGRITFKDEPMSFKIREEEWFVRTLKRLIAKKALGYEGTLDMQVQILSLDFEVFYT